MSTAAMADVVVMKNGDRLTGTLDSIAGGKLVLTTAYAGNVAIKVDEVDSIVTEEPFQVKVGRSKANGLFRTIGEQTMVGETPVELSAISRAGQESSGFGRLGTEWNSRADLSMVISNGNSDTESLNTLIESTLKRDTVQHAVSLLISQEEAEEETVKEQFDFDYGYKRFLSEKWYAAGNGEYFKDELKDIDARITLGAGMGYQVWDNSFGAFSVEAGISAVREDVDGDTDDNPAFRWALSYNRFLMAKQLEFFHKHALLVIPDSDSGEVISSSTGLRYALNDRIDTSARIDVNHETEPSPDSSKTDVTYTLGIGIKF
ncbi:MAG: DUF481 domain-containing protein [Pseudomonadales bacterium]